MKVQELDEYTENQFSDYCNKYGMITVQADMNYINDCLLMGIDIDSIYKIVRKPNDIRTEFIKIYLNTTNMEWFDKAVELYDLLKESKYISRARKYVELIRSIVLNGQSYEPYRKYFDECKKEDRFPELRDIFSIKNTNLTQTSDKEKIDVKNANEKIDMLIDSLSKVINMINKVAHQNEIIYKEYMEQIKQKSEEKKEVIKNNEIILKNIEEFLKTMKNDIENVISEQIEELSSISMPVEKNIQEKKDYWSKMKKKKNYPKTPLELVNVVMQAGFNGIRLNKIIEMLKAGVEISKICELIDMDMDNDDVFLDVCDVLIREKVLATSK